MFSRVFVTVRRVGHLLDPLPCWTAALVGVILRFITSAVDSVPEVPWRNRARFLCDSNSQHCSAQLLCLLQAYQRQVCNKWRLACAAQVLSVLSYTCRCRSQLCPRKRSYTSELAQSLQLRHPCTSAATVCVLHRSCHRASQQKCQQACCSSHWSQTAMFAVNIKIFTS